MARSFYSRFASSAGMKKRRGEGAQRAFKAEPPGALSMANPISRSKDPWLVEVNKRRKAVSDQYWRDKRKLQREKRYSDRDLRAELRRRKKEAERYYGLDRLKDNPRYKKAEWRAERKYGRKERELEREHHDKWQKTFHDLASRRDKDRRKVTKDFRKEYRQSRSAPDQPGNSRF